MGDVTLPPSGVDVTSATSTDGDKSRGELVVEDETSETVAESIDTPSCTSVRRLEEAEFSGKTHLLASLSLSRVHTMRHRNT